MASKGMGFLVVGGGGGGLCYREFGWRGIPEGHVGVREGQ